MGLRGVAGFVPPNGGLAAVVGSCRGGVWQATCRVSGEDRGLFGVAGLAREGVRMWNALYSHKSNVPIVDTKLLLHTFKFRGCQSWQGRKAGACSKRRGTLRLHLRGGHCFLDYLAW